MTLWLGNARQINEGGVFGMHNQALFFSLLSPFLEKSLTNQTEISHELFCDNVLLDMQDGVSCMYNQV